MSKCTSSCNFPLRKFASRRRKKRRWWGDKTVLNLRKGTPLKNVFHQRKCLVKTLEIKDEVPGVPAFDKQLLPSNPQQVEVQVLQSGQINFSTESNNTMCMTLEQRHSRAGTATASRASASNQLPTSSNACMLTSTQLPLSHQHHDLHQHLISSPTSQSGRVGDVSPVVLSDCDESTPSGYSDVSTQTQVSPIHYTTLVNHVELYDTAGTPPIVAVRENDRAHFYNTVETPPIAAVRENDRAHLYSTAETPPIAAVRENDGAHLYSAAETPPTAAIRENDRAQLYSTAETPPIITIPDTQVSCQGAPSDALVVVSNRKLNQAAPRRSARITSHKGQPEDEGRRSAAWKRGQLAPLLGDLSPPLPVKRSKPNNIRPDNVCKRLSQHPLEWCSEDVSAFVSEICSKYKDIFMEHEIDGESLLTLDPEMMVNCMNIKTGPALKIHKHILDLKRTYNITTF